jgi:phosphate starvation-inducible PhoH-like protein
LTQQAPKKKTLRKTTYKGADKKSSIPLVPRNDNQELYVKALKSSTQVIVFGPAGTGKTYIAATYAANLYITKAIDKIVITRPHVAVGREIGYLKGSLEDKTLPWALPVLDVLEGHLSKGAVEIAVKNNNIEVAPMALMRGRSFDNAFILVDEAQNITVDEIKMLLTRVGEGSTIVLNGDLQQSDIKETSGLAKITHLAKKHNLDLPVIEFGLDDVVRSATCKMWIEVFMKENL